MISIIVRIFLGLYAFLTMLATISQMREHLSLSVYGFGLGSVLLAIAAIFKQSQYGLYALIVGLIALHISALYHGLTTDFHLSHHLIRLVISIVIVYFYVKG